MARIWIDNQGNNFKLLILQADDLSSVVNQDKLLLIFPGDDIGHVDEGFSIINSPHL